MLNESETAQLRSLHERAYGREGGLTAEDAARLHELESKLRPVVVAPSVAEPLEVAAPVSIGEPSTASEVEASEAPPEEASAPPRRRRWLAFAAVGAVLIGLGVGWVLWGWNTAEFALAAAHAEQRGELEASGDYDEGTVAAVSENHGVVIWRAERGEGEQHCVIATTSTQTQSGCAAMEDSNSETANATITVPEGDELAGQTLSAYLLLSVTGEIVPTIQIWNQQDNNWEAQFSEEEREAIGRIEAAGFDPSLLSILGYDGDTPVWTSWGGEMCLIAESDDGIVSDCASTTETPPTDLILAATVGGVPTQYIVHQSATRGQQLTIVKVPEVTRVEVGDGEQIEIDDKTGDRNG
ncbi:hypothetical protein [Microbacterium sp. A84]|uniref:hypothetical protein n=1 Tax=Microbacterium sp. A84 TaxID=3450715 RepID=UPI003F440ABE